MSFTVDAQEQSGVVVAIFHNDFNFKEEIEALDAEMNSALDIFPDGAYMIIDTQAAHIGLKEAVFGTNFAVRNGTIVEHPNLKQLVVVSDNPLVHLSSRGMNSPAFNNVELAVFHTIEEAYAYTGAVPVAI